MTWEFKSSEDEIPNSLAKFYRAPPKFSSPNYGYSNGLRNQAHTPMFNYYKDQMAPSLKIEEAVYALRSGQNLRGPFDFK